MTTCTAALQLLLWALATKKRSCADRSEGERMHDLADRAYETAKHLLCEAECEAVRDG